MEEDVYHKVVKCEQNKASTVTRNNVVTRNIPGFLDSPPNKANANPLLMYSYP